MKVLSVPLWLLLFTICGLSQAPPLLPDQQNIEVIHKKWNMEIRNPLLDEDPFQAIKDTEQDQRDRKEYMRQSAIRAKLGLPQEPPPVRVKTPESAPAPSATAFYTYEAKFKNNGEKEIRALIWDYVFFDPETKLEVGRLKFESKVNINPGKTKNVVMRAASPPTGTINAAQAGKKTREQYTEQVVIRGIQYVDGSIWESAEKTAN